MLSLNNAFNFLNILQRAPGVVEATSLNPGLVACHQLSYLHHRYKENLLNVIYAKRVITRELLHCITPHPFHLTHNISPSGYSDPVWRQSTKCYAKSGQLIFTKVAVIRPHEVKQIHTNAQ